jgi:hypothetical protein
MGVDRRPQQRRRARLTWTGIAGAGLVIAAAWAAFAQPGSDSQPPTFGPVYRALSNFEGTTDAGDTVTADFLKAHRSVVVIASVRCSASVRTVRRVVAHLNEATDARALVYCVDLDRTGAGDLSAEQYARELRVQHVEAVATGTTADRIAVVVNRLADAKQLHEQLRSESSIEFEGVPVTFVLDSGRKSTHEFFGELTPDELRDALPTQP